MAASVFRRLRRNKSGVNKQTLQGQVFITPGPAGMMVEDTRASDSNLPRFRNHRNAGRGGVRIDVLALGQSII